MLPTKVQEILRRIVPWVLESNGDKKYRCNYKGVRGRIGIVGGARDYAGAPYFASMSAMKVGADLSYVICSEAAGQVIKTYSPDLIVTPILDMADEKEFLSEMECLFTRMHALVIGPGLGREKLLQSRAKTIIREAKSRSLPLVLDADSLLLINEDPTLVRSYPKALLTPNRIELQRMLDSLYSPKTFNLRNMETEKIKELVLQCSRDLNVSILAKGMVDYCSEPSGFTLQTEDTLGSNRRCGGQGDILSGVAGVIMHWIGQYNKELSLGDGAISHPAAWAGYLAAVLTRHCNELAYEQFRSGMLASNMVDRVNIALESLLEGRKEVKVIVGGNVKEADEKIIAKYSNALTQDEIERFRRQMIMEEFGPERQLKLKDTSILIVGAGGLGCPSAIYLGACGIGRIGVVDDDRVESSNLHRQILHNMNKIGMLKTESIKEAILQINPNVKVETHSVRMSRSNAVQLVEKYDIVIDATDNLLTRYMINDACVVAKKPLVSGAALKMDGQLSVYNYDEETPCFRCLFPEPPPPNAVGSCSDNGVLGVIPGIIGVQQALEAIKIGSGIRPAFAGKMLLFDGQLGLFRHITLSKRKANCEACGPNSKLRRELINYEDFCGLEGCASSQERKPTDILNSDERINTEQYRAILESNKPHILVDVRPLIHSKVSRFEHALQIPVAQMLSKPERSLYQIQQQLKSKNTNQIYVICRKGIASQRGLRVIQELFKGKETIVIKDIMGGMTEWAAKIDGSFSCL